MFVKHLVRYAVIAGLVGGTAALVAGPERLGALVDQTRGKINNVIDANIEDPIALRSQMRQLEGQYPERIAEVQGDLAELREQTAQLKRELAVSDRVVDLAAADLAQISDLIARGEAAQADGTRLVRVVFGNESIDLKDAYSRATRIQQVKGAYTTRATEIERDLGYLAQQEKRLADLATQLQTEYTEFQTQMWQMDRQVDTIARNDRLIAVMEKRQKTLDRQSRYEANSLDQLSSRFADIRAKQEARLESLGSSTTTLNYEDRAKFDLDARREWSGEVETLPEDVETQPTVIEISPEPVAKPKPIAFRGDR